MLNLRDIVEYLALYHYVNINVVFFSIFGDNEAKMLGRAWLISPDEVEQRTEAKRERGQIGEWTGYWFVNVGEGEGRSWEDCVRYGFISAGGDERAQRDMMKLQQIVKSSLISAKKATSDTESSLSLQLWLAISRLQMAQRCWLSR